MKANIVLLPVYFNQLQKNKNRLQNDFTKSLQKGKDRLRGDGLKCLMSIWTLVISLSTSSVTFKNKFGIGQKRVWLICFSRFNLLIYSFIGSDLLILS
jgi:hypothetical protein